MIVYWEALKKYLIKHWNFGFSDYCPMDLLIFSVITDNIRFEYIYRVTCVALWIPANISYILYHVSKDDCWRSNVTAPALRRKISVDTRSPLSLADLGAKIQSWQLTSGWSLPSTEESLLHSKQDSCSESATGQSQHRFLQPSIRLGIHNICDI